MSNPLTFMSLKRQSFTLSEYASKQQPQGYFFPLLNFSKWNYKHYIEFIYYLIFTAK